MFHFTTADLIDILGGQPTTASIARMRDQGTVVGFQVAQRGYLFPCFQIGTDRRRVDPVIARINRVLARELEPADVIAWLLTPSGANDPVPPAELGSARVIHALHRLHAHGHQPYSTTSRSRDT